MKTISIPQSSRLGLRLFSFARALPAVLTLAALAVTSQSSAQVQLPSGPPYLTVSPANSSFVAIGDMNGDGKKDVVISVAGSATLQVALGDGQGGFAAPRTFASDTAATFPGKVVLGDLNGDGNLDAVVINQGGLGSLTISVLFGDGAGNLSSPVIYDLFANTYNGHQSIYSIALANLRGNGKLDIVVSTNGDGPTGFQNGSGYSTSKVLVLQNNGSGVFTIPTTAVWTAKGFYAESAASELAVADMDGDGKLDIIVTSSFGDFNGNDARNVYTVLYGDGTGAFPTTAGGRFPRNGVGSPYAACYNAAGVAIADVNGDGKPDVIVCSSDFWLSGGGVAVFLSTGSRSFDDGTSFRHPYRLGANPIVVADLNNDGSPDLIISGAGTGGDIFYFLNDGTGVFSVLLNGDAYANVWSDTYEIPATFCYGMAVGDLTNSGPGTTDIVIATPGAHTLLLKNGPAGAPPPPPPTPTLTATLPVLTVPANITVNATSSAGAPVNFTATATSHESMELFRRNTVTAEQWKSYTTTFTAGVTGNFTLGFNVVSASGGDNSIFVDDVKLTSGANTLLADGFETPALASSSGVFADTGDTTVPVALGSNWTFTNYGGIMKGPGAPNWGTIANGTPPEGSQHAVLRDVIAKQTKMKAVSQISLVAGQVYTLTFQQASREIFGGTLTYTVTLERDVSVPVTATPASGSTFPIGITSVNLSATNSAGGTTTGSFTVTVKGTPPVITAASPLTLEATSSAGASTASFGTAVDFNGASLPITATPVGPYAIGITQVNLSATDSNGLTTTKQIVVNVVDTTAPVIANVPANLTAEATSASGAAVSYSAATATDAVGVSSLTYSAASGSTFPLGTTPVTITAKDAAGNTSTASFTVTVKDTTAPALAGVPGNLTVEATSSAGAAVTYAAATATDAVTASPTITYSAASGSTFALGTTTVTVTAKDAAGNTSSASFMVTVRDTTPPVIATVSGNVVVEATSAAGATATYAAATTTDVVGPVTLNYSKASGSVFPIGTTTVTVNAVDGAGNAAVAKIFTVTVQDTTAPVITVPIVATVEATSAAGALVNYAAATATDAVGVTSLIYSKASGTTFAIGTTTVTVTAKDAAGNISTKTFNVTVKDSTAPAITATMSAKGGGDDESTQSFTIAFSATDAVGVKTLTAVLNGVTVTNGQVVQLQTIKSGAQTVKRDDGKLQIKATSFSLVVTSTDAAGNTSTKTVVPVFVKNGKDDDNKGGDKNDDGKGSGGGDDKGGKSGSSDNNNKSSSDDKGGKG